MKQNNASQTNFSAKAGLLNRDESLKKLKQYALWDIIIIGGGATGLGIAVDAANRGFSTLLLEQSDFAKGTSSRSTKLVHGGVRYLAQGKIGLVYVALQERGILIKNAPHIVKRQPFIIPCYNHWEKYQYLFGLKLYDWLSGKLSFGRSEFLSTAQLAKEIPAINTKGLKGGIKYFDGQFDDSRLAINLAQTCAEQGGVVLNYFAVTNLIKKDGNITGVVATDVEKGDEYNLKSKTVINATGVFVDEILRMDTPGGKPIVRPSQGIHLVFDKSFLNSNSALMIPKTTDGRVLFAVPWHHHILVGTTDTPLNEHSLEPKALNEEIDFIFKNIAQYFYNVPERKDVLSVFAGLRPLAAPQKETGNTKEISRELKILVSASGLITITGGKWTTYRHMAEVTVDRAIKVSGLKKVPCKTGQLPIHGYTTISKYNNHLDIYGTDANGISLLMSENPSLQKKLIENLHYTEAEVVWAVRHEMARTVEDVLARRIRILFLDARAAISAAPKVSEIIAKELGYNQQWQNQQLELFYSLAKNYLLDSKLQNVQTINH